MAKKNNKKSKIDTWLPICTMGGALVGSVVSIVLENVIYFVLGSCIGLTMGIIIGADDIKFEEEKTTKKSSKVKANNKTKTKKK